MADVFFKARVAGVDYELPKLDLNGARILKKKFGLKQLEDFNLTDPEHLMGMFYLSLIHAGVDPGTADAQVADIDVMDAMNLFVLEEPVEPPDDEAKEESPTVAAPASGKKQRAASKSATTRKTPGPQK